MTLFFDLEANGFLTDEPKADRLWCAEVWDSETDTWSSYRSPAGDLSDFHDLVAQLQEASEICAHNALGYDVPLLEELYGVRFDRRRVRDTLVESRLIWPELGRADFSREGFPRRLSGDHSLEAWGWRLRERKQEWKHGFEEWHPEMPGYCRQDVKTLARLARHTAKQNVPIRARELEHRFADVIARRNRVGCGFATEEAEKLCGRLAAARTALRARVDEAFEPWLKEWETPKKKLKRSKVVPFNPNSSPQIIRHFTERRGWKPTKAQLTRTGNPSATEKILRTFSWPEAEVLADYLLVNSRLRSLAEGPSGGYLGQVRDHRLYGMIWHVGAPTARCSHSKPNLANIPKASSPWGREFRSLFRPRPGWVMVGADASGIEVRGLAHYLAKLDGGAYRDRLLHGDIHLVHRAALPVSQDDAGRDQGKTFFYAFLYGAQGERLGRILGSTTEVGARTRHQFAQRIEGLAQLIRGVQKVGLAKGYLIGLDGRKLFCRDKHAMLNTLLQGFGAIVMKLATVLACEEIYRKYPHRAELMLHVHDEMQFECEPEIKHEVGRICVWAFEEAGRQLGVRLPLTGEYKHGESWADTH